MWSTFSWAFFNHLYSFFDFIFKKILFHYFQREGKGGRKGGRETSMCGCLLCAPNWGPAHNPGMFPSWESNQWPFGLQAAAQSTEPPQPGPICISSLEKCLFKSFACFKIWHYNFNPYWTSKHWPLARDYTSFYFSFFHFHLLFPFKKCTWVLFLKSTAQQSSLDSTSQYQMKFRTTRFPGRLEKEVWISGLECFRKPLRIKEEFDLGISVWVGIRYLEKRMRSSWHLSGCLSSLVVLVTLCTFCPSLVGSLRCPLNFLKLHCVSVFLVPSFLNLNHFSFLNYSCHTILY